MNPRLLLCNCKGLCQSFKNTDMNTLPFQLETELDVEYVMLHPQLCGQGGNAVLLELLRAAAAEPDARVVVGACAPDAQLKLFKKVLRQAGFPEERLVPIDIRSTDNEGILQRLRAAVETPQHEGAGH